MGPSGRPCFPHRDFWFDATAGFPQRKNETVNSPTTEIYVPIGGSSRLVIQIGYKNLSALRPSATPERPLSAA
jgi:hypothetical protein